MTEEDKKAKRAAYMREWSRKNPEKAKEAAAKSRLKRRAAQAELTKKHYRENAEAYKVRSRIWSSENKTRKNESAKEWRKENTESVKQTAEKYRTGNGRHIVAAATRRRQAQKLKATPAWANKSAIAELYREAAELTKNSGSKWHVDHIVPPLSEHVCGLHVEWNLKVLHWRENIMKSNKNWPDAWSV